MKNREIHLPSRTRPRSGPRTRNGSIRCRTALGVVLRRSILLDRNESGHPPPGTRWRITQRMRADVAYVTCNTKADDPPSMNQPMPGHDVVDESVHGETGVERCPLSEALSTPFPNRGSRSGAVLITISVDRRRVVPDGSERQPQARTMFASPGIDKCTIEKAGLQFLGHSQDDSSPSPPAMAGFNQAIQGRYPCPL